MRKPGWCDPEHDDFDEAEFERALVEQHAYDESSRDVPHVAPSDGITKGLPVTDRFIALTVLLDHEIREDDAEPLITAIQMIKGVSKVTPVVANVDVYFAYEKARNEILNRVLEAIENTTPSKPKSERAS